MTLPKVLSARGRAAIFSCCFLLGVPLITRLSYPTGLCGLLFAYPLYHVTSAWGRRGGLAAAAIGMVLNSTIWLAVGSGRQVLHRGDLAVALGLWLVECAATVLFVLVVSRMPRRDAPSERGSVVAEHDPAPLLLAPDTDGLLRAREELAAGREAYRVLENKYRVLFELAPEAIWVVQDAHVVFFNNRALDMLGYTRAEMSGMPLEQIYEKGDWEKARACYLARVEGTRIPQCGCRQVTRSGKVICVEAVGRRIDWEGKDSVLYFVSDVTERRALEEQSAHSQRMEAIGRLSGGIAHDFNNLLQVILGFCTMIRENPKDRAAMLGDMRLVEQAAQRAASLTQQLLAFGRKDAAHPVVAVDLAQIVRQAELIFRRVLGEDVALDVRVGEGPHRVMADPSELQRVIMNLALNARDAMPGGGHMLISVDDISLSEPGVDELPGGDYVRLKVSDTGHGMDDSTMSHLFEPFFTTKEPGRGTGLGLSIVQNIVTRCRGRITVESSLGVGSKFTVLFPHAAGLAGKGVERAGKPSLRGSGSILLVEDERGVRQLVGRILEGAGYSVTPAESGEEALRICQARDRPFDLLITDVVLTGMRGGFLAQSARTYFSGMEVLLISGYPAAPGTAPPRQGYPLLRKPFSSTELLDQVAKLLSQKPRASSG